MLFTQQWVSRLEDTRQVQWAFGADNEVHGFTTTMPSEVETFRMSAMNCTFAGGKVTRGAIGAPSKSGLWLGPARVIMTEAIQQWSGSVHSTTGQIGVVWLSHGNKPIRCHPTQLRRCSKKRGINCFSERSGTNFSTDECDRIDECLCLLDNTKTCRPMCQIEMICALVRWILRYLPLIRKPWHLLMYRCFLLAPLSTQLQNTSARLSSIPKSCFCIFCSRV